MSWLKNALQQSGDYKAQSGGFRVGSHEFILVYQPQSGIPMGCPNDQFAEAAKGSLVLRHDTTQSGITLRYSFCVKRGDEWVQWGETANECHPDDNTQFWCFGPDVEEHDGEAADGVFGLSHEELLSSEWVENDTLTVKVKLKVREAVDIEYFESSKPRVVDVPSNTMASEFLALLEGGEGSDVVCVVEGQELNVHSGILCGRCVRQPGAPFLSSGVSRPPPPPSLFPPPFPSLSSEVFKALLLGGMREAAEKRVVVEDVDLVTFQALLKFVYSDDLRHVEEWTKSAIAESEGDAPPQRKRVAVL